MCYHPSPALFLLLTLFIGFGCTDEPSPEEEFITLYNGEDLSSWTTETGDWRIEDGILVVHNPGDYNTVNSSYLWTRDSFDDFVLELEFKIAHEPLYGLEIKKL